MLSAKKTIAKKPSLTPEQVRSRLSTLTKANVWSKVTLLGFMFKHDMVVPRMLSMSSLELVQAMQVYIEEGATTVTWNDVLTGIDDSEQTQEKSISEWKSMIDDISTRDSDRLLTVIFPLLAKWKLHIGWDDGYRDICKFTRSHGAYEIESEWNTYIIYSASRARANAHFLRNNTYTLGGLDKKYQITIRITPDVLQTTDDNTDIFRITNIKNVSNRSLILPPSIVSAVLYYTQKLLLDDCRYKY